nr:GNAT family N-acetyltransferase [Mammaliicoccus sp. Marseille-Q6498]
MFELKFIDDDSLIYKVSQMAALSFKEESQSMNVAVLLEFEAIKRSLQYEKSALVGAFNNEECVGFIWAKYDDSSKTAKIYNLFVSENYRNKGIATNLKQEIESWAVKMGAHTIVSTVDVRNVNMIHINESMDYEVEKIIMRKKLL